MLIIVVGAVMGAVIGAVIGASLIEKRTLYE